MKTPDSSLSETASQKILVVDDNAANLSVLQKFLSSEGYRLFFAKSGEQALVTAAAAQPDLILLDVSMPGIGGHEACRRLKQQESTRHIPVIFATASKDTQDIVMAYGAGGVDYITKPLQYEEVCVRVRTHLQIRSLFQEQELRRQAEIKAAYVAGKAYIISNSLHHLGNLLNSVKVSIAKIQSVVEETEVSTLRDVVVALEKYASNLSQDEPQPSSFFQSIKPLLEELQGVLEHETHQIRDESLSMRERLNHIEQLFSLMREQEEPVQFSEVISLNVMVTTAIEIVRLSLGDKGYKILNTIEDALTIHGNRSELIHVFTTVLTNAIEAVRAGHSEQGCVTVSAARLPASSENLSPRVRVLIADNGIGISEENLPKVFFSGFTTKHGHSGLSLHWSHLALSQMGGDLTVTSQEGKGTTFSLEFSLDPQPIHP